MRSISICNFCLTQLHILTILKRGTTVESAPLGASDHQVAEHYGNPRCLRRGQRLPRCLTAIGPKRAWQTSKKANLKFPSKCLKLPASKWKGIWQGTTMITCICSQFTTEVDCWIFPLEPSASRMQHQSPDWGTQKSTNHSETLSFCACVDVVHTYAYLFKRNGQPFLCSAFTRFPSNGNGSGYSWCKEFLHFLFADVGRVDHVIRKSNLDAPGTASDMRLV